MKPSVKSLIPSHCSYSFGLFAFRHKPRSDGSRSGKKKWGRQSHRKAFLLPSTSIQESQQKSQLGQPYTNCSLTKHMKKKKEDPKHQGVQYLNYFMVMLGKQEQNNFVVWLLFSRKHSFVKLHEREQKPLDQDL